MAYSLNQIMLIGNITEKPEMRKTPSGSTVTDINLQVKARFNRDDGDNQLSTSFHTVVLWNRQAEIVDQYLKAGSPLFVLGRLKTEEWEGDDGQKRRKTKVISQEIILLDSKNETTHPGEESSIFGGLNKVEILGNLTKDPELRKTPNGVDVCNFRVATNRKWRSREDDSLQEETEFHNIVVWNELAVEVSEKIKKGYKVYIKGRCTSRGWETPDGEKRRITEVVADNVLLVGFTDQDLAEGKNNQSENNTATTPTEKIEEELPEIPEIKHESSIKPEDLPF